MNTRKEKRKNDLFIFSFKKEIMERVKNISNIIIFWNIRISNTYNICEINYTLSDGKDYKEEKKIK